MLRTMKRLMALSFGMALPVDALWGSVKNYVFVVSIVLFITAGYEKKKRHSPSNTFYVTASVYSET